ncbi:hypothetical protein [Methylomonas sp. ZR1]|uniref:Uncharacterized protein n=2 Tax=Methylomonas koyamae TaxID=702114 RepID=A0A177NJ45_9GAMM|nr:hypothetical protein [Methylomonas sp. ZR1]NOV30743.1 hypothetical protein [Methylomonas sp. ZR1]OAI17594.1 hypothetical protein A1355_07680 [Methylomonas koyamae]
MTLITQPNVSAIQAETSTVRYLNHYRCPYCQTEWEDEWDCACNDRCPHCNKEIEPYESSLIDCGSAETGSPVEAPSLAKVPAKGMNRLFVVSYEIDYVHRVSVGITADSPEAAQQIAEQAFNDATIWDDTVAMPLLSDEYHESGDESLLWECVAVEQWPEPDHSVRQLKKEQAAMRVCRGLVEAYQQGKANGGSVDWENLDPLIPVALQALGKTALENKS